MVPNSPAPAVPQFTARPDVETLANDPTAPGTPLSADEWRAIDEADEWLFSPQAPTAGGDDRLRIAIVVAKIVRDIGVPADAAVDRIDNWSVCSCTPPLDDPEIELAVRVVYGLTGAERGQDIGRPHLADAVQPVGEATKQAPQSQAQASSSTGAELTAQPAPAGQPEAIEDDAVDLPTDPETLATERETATEEAVDNASSAPLDEQAAGNAPTCIVIRVDPRNGGNKTFASLAQKEHFPKTARAKTRNGVNYIVYAVPASDRVKGVVLGPGVEICIASASEIDELMCRRVNTRPVAFAPQWLSDRCQAVPLSINASTADVSGDLVNTGNDLVNTTTTRKVGRPPGRTKDKPFQMRVDNTFITKIDNWRRQQPDFPNRTESVRRLVEQALNGERG